MTIIACGECWLNWGIASLILSQLLDEKRRPSHCTGVTTCITRFNKKIEGAISRKHGTRFLLVVDREKARELQEYLKTFLEKYSCKPKKYARHTAGKHVIIYECLGRATLIVFNGPPEEILKEIDDKLKELLENPDNVKRFKNRREIVKALESIRARLSDEARCNDAVNVVERGLCALFKEVKRSWEA